MNKICKKCIKYCNVNSPNLLNFSKTNNINIGHKIQSIGNDVLWFAPVGNYPLTPPEITVCGLATSGDNALKHAIKFSEKNSVVKSCLKSVYYGRMAINLALMLKSIGIENRCNFNLDDITKNKAVQKNTNLKNITGDYLGSKGTIKTISDNLQLTQSTCCWTSLSIIKNKIGLKSEYNKHWSGFSHECRNNGYLKKILNNYLSDNKKKIFIFLGKENLSNLWLLYCLTKNKNHILIKFWSKRSEAIKYLLNDSSILSNSIDGMSNYNENIANNPTEINHIESWLEQVTNPNEQKNKLILFVHHPANTGYIYNPYNKYESILYRFYNNLSKGDGINTVKCWENLVKETENNKYYYGKNKTEKNIKTYLKSVTYYYEIVQEVIKLQS